MSMYFDKQDLALLKAIAYTKDTTVNKILMNVLKESLEITINSLPSDFNIETLAKNMMLNVERGRAKLPLFN